ncbi:MAG: hypothetical protein J6L64_07855 [Opitutales bacterium]|nr:hypothetical protein [Opitutales bacterium]
MPTPTPEQFFAVFGSIAAILVVVHTAVRIWREFAPPKNKSEVDGDKKAVTRKEFESRMTAMQERSDEFRERLSANMADTREAVSRLEEAVRQQNKNFLNAAEVMRKSTADVFRGFEHRLASIESHLRK